MNLAKHFAAGAFALLLAACGALDGPTDADAIVVLKSGR